MTSVQGVQTRAITVRPGDTYYGVAARYGLKPKDLDPYNQHIADKSRLEAGATIIYVPMVVDAHPAPAVPPAVRPIRVRFTIRTPAELAQLTDEQRLAHAVYSQITTTPDRVLRLKRALGVFSGTSEVGVELVGRQSLTRLVDAAAAAGYPLTADGLARLRALAATGEEELGPRTAQALVDLLLAKHYGAAELLLEPPQEIATGARVSLSAMPAAHQGVDSNGAPRWSVDVRILRAARANTIGIATYDAALRRYAAMYRLPYPLVKAVTLMESNFDPAAKSRAQAFGLMQLTQGTAGELGVDRVDPEQNIQGGCAYLRKLANRFDGDVRLVLAAYNAGPGAVAEHNGVPPFAETQGYVKWVLVATAYYDALEHS